MALTSAQQITQLYVGYFNRAPDPEGLNYWIGRLDSGEMNVQQIAQSFSEQPETLATYPFLRYPNLLENDAEAFITEIYQNAFNRAPDEEGLAYWTEQLISGAVPVGDFIASVISGAQNTAAGQDLTTINNKTTVGLDYATQVAAANVEWTQASAHAALEGVTDALSTVVTAQANIVKFIETGTWPGTVGDTYTLTTAPDTILGTVNNDTVKGILSDADDVPSTFNALDSIDGAGGVNTLELAIVGATPDDVVLLPHKASVSIQNIQDVRLVSADGSTAATAALGTRGSLDATYFGSQLQNLWQVGAAADVTGLVNGQTAGFEDVFVAGAGGGLKVGFTGTDASIAIKDLVSETVFAVEGSKVTNLSISGSITADEDGASKLGFASLGGATKTVELNFDSDADIGLYSRAVGQFLNVVTVDASGSTGDLTLNLASLPAGLKLESLSFGSGSDKGTLALNTLTAKDVSVDLGDGNDAFAVALTTGVKSNLEITTGEGKDVIAFGSLVEDTVAGNLTVVDDAFTNGNVTITDFDSANDTLQIAGFNGFTAQNLIDAALASSDIDSLFDAVSAVAGVVGKSGTNITDFAQFVYEGNTYVYGDVGEPEDSLNGDLLIALTGTVDLNNNNVTVFGNPELA